jgi:hypothetical protein
MKKEINETYSSKNKSNSGFMSIIKKATAPVIAAALLASCSPSNSTSTPDTRTIQIGQ